MTAELLRRVEALTGRKAAAARPLTGGSVGRVWRIDLTNGGALAAKQSEAADQEAWALRYLAARTRLPTPDVVFEDGNLLLMQHLPAGDKLDDQAQIHAAQLLAGLHAVSWHSFGFERDTWVGGLRQDNTPTSGWIEFFRDKRLLFMAEQAVKAGKLESATAKRVEQLAARLAEWIDEPQAPALVHGDCWSGNILVKNGRVTGFIDPALYFGHAEMDLAFGALFGCFGPAFYDEYSRHSPIAPGFFDARKDLYQLYPLLVHARLFGGSYVQGVERILDRFLG